MTNNKKQTKTVGKTTLLVKQHKDESVTITVKNGDGTLRSSKCFDRDYFLEFMEVRMEDKE